MKTINRQHIWLSLGMLLLAAQVFTLVWIWKHPCTPSLVAQKTVPRPVVKPEEADASPLPAVPVAATAAVVSVPAKTAYRPQKQADGPAGLAVDQPVYAEKPTSLEPKPRRENSLAQNEANVRSVERYTVAKAERPSTSQAPEQTAPAEDPNNPLPPGHRPQAPVERLAYPRQQKPSTPSALSRPVSHTPIQQPVYPVAHYSRF